MNHVERFRAVMNFQAVDRLPRWEWAMWWDQTIDRWHGEGLPAGVDASARFSTLPVTSVSIPISSSGSAPRMRPSKPRSIMSKAWFPTWTTTCASGRSCFPITVRAIRGMTRGPRGRSRARPWSGSRSRASSGFRARSWASRRLMYAFYGSTGTAAPDQPGSVGVQPGDCSSGSSRSAVPTFMTIAEDMSYNHGPMISKGGYGRIRGPVLPPAAAAAQEYEIPPSWTPTAT